jgi:copper chaperone CopZ
MLDWHSRHFFVRSGDFYLPCGMNYNVAMKRPNLSINLMLGIALAVWAGATARPVEARSSLPSRLSMVSSKRVQLAIGGMDCKGCESGISGELLRTPGVIAAQVSYERLEAVVDYDPAKITPAGIIAAIKGAGFTAKIKR